MKICFNTNSNTATPIRPLFKGNVNNQNVYPLFKACPNFKMVNNKNLEVDKFEKR